MQSQVGKTQNFEQAAQHITDKIETDPSSITSEVSEQSKHQGCGSWH